MLGTPIENATDNADVAFFTLCNPSNGITIFLIIVFFGEIVCSKELKLYKNLCTKADEITTIKELLIHQTKYFEDNDV